MKYVCCDCENVFDESQMINWSGDFYCENCYKKSIAEDEPLLEEPIVYGKDSFEKKKHWWND